MVDLLRELRDDLDLSIVFITHEMDTVLKIADSVARLDHGTIAESGRLVDLLTDPQSALGSELRPHRVDATPGVPLAVLGASVQVVAGVTIGGATLGIPADVGARVAGVLAGFGLSANTGAAIEPELEVVA